MLISDYFHLSHRELTAFRTRSLATVIVIGILFGLLLGANTILQGLENTVLRRAGEATQGQVYIASDYDDGRRPELIRDRIAYYGGQIVEVPAEDLAGLDFTPQYVAVFPNLKHAFDYYWRQDTPQPFNYSRNRYNVAELYTNQMSAYNYFRRIQHNIQPFLIILLIAAILILTFTTAHLIAQNTLSISLYRSLGATHLQIFGVYLAYILELCFYAMLFAITLALILAGIATICGWAHLQSALAQFYPNSTAFPLILVGINSRSGIILSVLFAAAPLAFLLCIDQFSSKKVAQRLKGD